MLQEQIKSFTVTFRSLAQPRRKPDRDILEGRWLHKVFLITHIPAAWAAWKLAILLLLEAAIVWYAWLRPPIDCNGATTFRIVPSRDFVRLDNVSTTLMQRKSFRPESKRKPAVFSKPSNFGAGATNSTSITQMIKFLKTFHKWRYYRTYRASVCGIVCVSSNVSVYGAGI